MQQCTSIGIRSVCISYMIAQYTLTSVEILSFVLPAFDKKNSFFSYTLMPYFFHSSLFISLHSCSERSHSVWYLSMCSDHFVNKLCMFYLIFLQNLWSREKNVAVGFLCKFFSFQILHIYIDIFRSFYMLSFTRKKKNVHASFFFFSFKENSY